MSKEMQGEYMYALAKRLFPIGRSLTGEGVRKTLKIIKERIPLKVHEVPSGTKAFDWTVPKEWNVHEAYIVTPDGKKIADYHENNLHLVGYSIPVDSDMSLKELQEHLHSIPGQPTAIPYVTSYYSEQWGFCLSQNERALLREGIYHVHIDTELKKGSLTYADLVIPGASKKEVLLSTYICHPSMANNELSGPVLVTALAKWLMKKPRKYTYRFVFIPETIGSIIYLSKHLIHLKEQVIAGFVVTCVGDNGKYSFIASRNGNTLADRVARRVLAAKHPNFRNESYLLRGSDERNYCSPGADLPVASIMRSRYGLYPEYHTSLDNLSLISSKGLQGSFDIYKSILEILEKEPLYHAAYIGEPQLGKRGLYPTLSKSGSVTTDIYQLVNILAYADGTRLPQDIADQVGLTLAQLKKETRRLAKHGLLVEV